MREKRKADEKRRQSFAGAFGCVAPVGAQPFTVSEITGAGYGRGSCGGEGQATVRILRRRSELSTQLNNQYFLYLGQP